MCVWACVCMFVCMCMCVYVETHILLSFENVCIEGLFEDVDQGHSEIDRAERGKLLIHGQMDLDSSNAPKGAGFVYRSHEDCDRAIFWTVFFLCLLF